MSKIESGGGQNQPRRHPVLAKDAMRTVKIDITVLIVINADLIQLCQVDGLINLYRYLLLVHSGKDDRSTRIRIQLVHNVD